jgi:alpha-galactosidase
MSITHLQSTSDQQDFRLYPPVAASAPVTILPEQCGNWAYPSVEMSAEETVFTLVTGLSGRLHLSGFLDRLRDEQRDLVRAAAQEYKALRQELDVAEPFWPLGLPGWDDPTVCLGLRTPTRALLFVWDRHQDASCIDIPGVTGTPIERYPVRLTPWKVSTAADGVGFVTVPGHTARVYELARTH